MLTPRTEPTDCPHGAAHCDGDTMCPACARDARAALSAVVDRLWAEDARARRQIRALHAPSRRPRRVPLRAE